MSERTPFQERIHLRSLSAHHLISGAVVIILFYFTVIPFLVTIYSSFTAHGFSYTGRFGFENWTSTFEVVRPILITTAIYTFGAASLTTILAILVSWCIARTSMPFSRLYFFLIFSVLFMPPVAWENAMVRLLGPGGIYPSVLGLETLNIYSVSGMIFVQAIRTLPWGMILLVPLYSSVNRALEESSRISGAGIFQTATKITIPLVKPGIWTVFILSLLISLESFRVPLVIGLPKKIVVLSTAIFSAAQVSPVNYGIAMVESVLLILFAAPLLYIYKRATSNSEKFAAMAGQNYRRGYIPIGRIRYLLSGIIGAFLLLFVIAPVLLMIYTSLIPFYVSPLSGAIPPLSFAAYTSLLQNSKLTQALLNSLITATVSSTLLIIFSVALAWLIHKSKIPNKDLIDYLAFIPIGMPSIVLALGLAFIYLRLIPIGVYGTLVIFVIAFTTRFLPGTLRLVDPAVIQIDDDLLDASRVVGASRIQRLKSIIFPLVKDSIDSAWAMRFGFVFLEMPIVMMLRSPDTEMVSSIMYQLQAQARYTEMAAMGVVSLVFLMLVTVLIRKI